MQQERLRSLVPFCEPLGSLSFFCASSILSARQKQHNPLLVRGAERGCKADSRLAERVTNDAAWMLPALLQRKQGLSNEKQIFFHSLERGSNYSMTETTAIMSGNGRGGDRDGAGGLVESRSVHLP